MKDDKRLNEVIRIQKRQNNFVMMDKTFLENSCLSWKAKGILAYLLGKPDNWKVIVRDLINHAADGKSAVYSGLNELREYGYYDKRPVRDERGHFIRWESTIYESPGSPLPENQEMGSPLPGFSEMDKPDMGNPDMENRERSNNYLSNNDFNNNQSSQSVGDRPDRTEPHKPKYSMLSREEELAEIERQIYAYTLELKTNISYADLAAARPYDMKLVDEFIAIIVDTVMTEGRTVRIGGEDKPRALVTGQLMKLNYGDIELVLDQFKSVTERISKKKQYILAMLYNVRLENDAHYTNRVKSDLWQ